MSSPGTNPSQLIEDDVETILRNSLSCVGAHPAPHEKIALPSSAIIGVGVGIGIAFGF
jgi:hypothetical protein